jgi:hypothetical protein
MSAASTVTEGCVYDDVYECAAQVVPSPRFSNHVPLIMMSGFPSRLISATFSPSPLAQGKEMAVQDEGVFYR